MARGNKSTLTNMRYVPILMGHPMNWASMDIFTKVNGEDANLQNANQNVSISLSVTSTAFQSEMHVMATAAASLLQHDCKMFSIILHYYKFYE